MNEVDARNGTSKWTNQHANGNTKERVDTGLSAASDPFHSNLEGGESLIEELQSSSEDKQAPNILLNLHYSSKIEELVFASIVGMVLQGGVLVYGACVTYLSALNHGIGADTDTVDYGYPLLAAGTILMTAGLIISASVIERSSTETKWFVDDQRAGKGKKPTRKAVFRRRSRRQDPNMHVLWLQQQQSLGAHIFYSYILRAKGDCKDVITSRPTRELRRLASRTPDSQLNSMERSKWRIEHTRISKIFGKSNLTALTVIGAVIGLVGYIVQFQGIRSVDWTVSVAQVGTVIVMSVLRAWLRRGLTTKPYFTSAIHEHEMDCLASEMAVGNIRFWPKDEGEDGRGERSARFCLPIPLSRKSPNTTAALRPQSEKCCTKCPTHSPLALKDPLAWSLLLAYDGVLLNENEEEDSETPDIDRQQSGVAQKALDIRCRLGNIVDWSSPVSSQAKSVGSAIQQVMNKFLTSGTTFVWQFDIPFGGRAHKVTINLKRENSVDSTKQGHWEDASSKIEAAMSLWLYHAKKQDMDHVDAPSSVQQAPLSEEVAYRWVLGPDTDGCLSRNLAWWSGAELALERGPAEWFTGHRVVGCRGMHVADNLGKSASTFRGRG